MSRYQSRDRGSYGGDRGYGGGDRGYGSKSSIDNQLSAVKWNSYKLSEFQKNFYKVGDYYNGRRGR